VKCRKNHFLVAVLSPNRQTKGGLGAKSPRAECV
jgi:hypothetical protein